MWRLPSVHARFLKAGCFRTPGFYKPCCADWLQLTRLLTYVCTAKRLIMLAGVLVRHARTVRLYGFLASLAPLPSHAVTYSCSFYVCVQSDFDIVLVFLYVLCTSAVRLWHMWDTFFNSRAMWVTVFISRSGGAHNHWNSTRFFYILKGRSSFLLFKEFDFPRFRFSNMRFLRLSSFVCGRFQFSKFEGMHLFCFVKLQLPSCSSTVSRDCRCFRMQTDSFDGCELARFCIAPV